MYYYIPVCLFPTLNPHKTKPSTHFCLRPGVDCIGAVGQEGANSRIRLEFGEATWESQNRGGGILLVENPKLPGSSYS